MVASGRARQRPAIVLSAVRPARSARGLRARLRAFDPNVRRPGRSRRAGFLADVSSKIAYPLFPLFVTSVLGAPVAVLGLIEGVAEATASITKYPFGQAADYTGRRRPFVLGGYTLGALGKLVIALAAGWPLALAGRFVDRFGKGMRTAARDDLIVPPPRRNSRDWHSGFTGPWTRWAPYSARSSLWPWSSLTCLCADLRHRRGAGPVERPRHPPAGEGAAGGAAAHGLSAVVPASPAFRWLLAGSLLFAAGNSSDMFILLKAKEVGLGTSAVILLYVLYNVTGVLGRLAAARRPERPGGSVPPRADRLRVVRRRVRRLRGSEPGLVMAVLFAAYGPYIAATEGTSKALIGRAIPSGERAWASVWTRPRALPASRPARSAASCGRRWARGRRSPWGGDGPRRGRPRRQGA